MFYLYVLYYSNDFQSTLISPSEPEIFMCHVCQKQEVEKEEKICHENSIIIQSDGRNFYIVRNPNSF